MTIPAKRESIIEYNGKFEVFIKRLNVMYVQIIFKSTATASVPITAFYRVPPLSVLWCLSYIIHRLRLLSPFPSLTHAITLRFPCACVMRWHPAIFPSPRHLKLGIRDITLSEFDHNPHLHRMTRDENFSHRYRHQHIQVSIPHWFD